jgi:homoserine kinase
MAYPGIEVSTKAARDVLPTNYSRADLIRYGQNLATFVDACHRQDKQQAFSAVEDVVAESYREHLLPGYSQAKAYLIEQGALAVGISGSGPTLFCVSDDLAKAKMLSGWLTKNYLKTVEGPNGPENNGFVYVCKADNEGACVVS